MPSSVVSKYFYADLTGPKVNEAVTAEKVILLPVGSTEQPGPHWLQSPRPCAPQAGLSK